MEDNNPKINYFPVPLIITSKNDKKALELRKLTTDPAIIKAILTAALHEQGIIIFPSFSDRLRAIATLAEKGIIEVNPKNNTYDFLI